MALVITTVLSAWVGSLFVYSGTMKLAEPISHRVKVVAGYRLLPQPTAHMVALALPVAEVIVGLLILIGTIANLAFLAAALLGAVFLFASGTALFRGIDVSCGCAGRASASVTTMTVVRATAITVVAAGLFLESTRSGGLGWFGVAVALAAAGPGALPAGVRAILSKRHQRDIADLLKLIGA
jgi:uncharacterized membrane protein YphA (DoxX/SURF4 family)